LMESLKTLKLDNRWQKLGNAGSNIDAR
jgi:hypothetical protein